MHSFWYYHAVSIEQSIAENVFSIINYSHRIITLKYKHSPSPSPLNTTQVDCLSIDFRHNMMIELSKGSSINQASKLDQNVNML